MRLAAVQSAPVFLDRDATVEKAVRLILEAGRNGADIVAFPEGFIPSHPHWYHFHAASSSEALGFSKRLAQNGILVPGPEVDTLCGAAREAGTFVVMGCCEREEAHRGTLYNTLLFIDSRGELVGRHRKLVPTLGERLVHSRGDAQGLRAYRAREDVRVSGLMCGENSNPLATHALDLQGTAVHVASWPSFFQQGASISDAVQMVSRALAHQMKAFVINSVSHVDERMLEELPLTPAHIAHMRAQGCGTSIIGPMGTVLAGPMGPGEGILYADVDESDLIAPKLVQDFSGHTSRADLLRLVIERSTPEVLQFADDGTGLKAEHAG